VGLADTWRPQKKHVLGLADEVAGGQIIKVFAVGPDSIILSIAISDEVSLKARLLRRAIIGLLSLPAVLFYFCRLAEILAGLAFWP
jgi:hypothetical protein